MAAATDPPATAKAATAPLFDLRGRRVFVAGHRGMVGSAIVRRLADVDCEVLTIGHDRLDLLRQDDTAAYLHAAKPDAVIVAAAKVGGIAANSAFPADFIYQNLMIATNVIDAAFRANVAKLLFLGSSCIYPRLARQPMAEEELLSGPLEPTNEFYAIAKIAAIKLCAAYRRQYGADFISVMPTNVYGLGDNYHPQDSHVIAGLMRRLHEAKQSASPTVAVWGTGTPQREFIFADDLADACIFVMENYSAEEHLNIGTGEEITTARARGPHRRRRGLSRQARVRRLASGRHAAQAARCREADRAGLDIAHAVARRPGTKLCGFHRARRRSLTTLRGRQRVIPVQAHRHLAAENIQQHPDASGIIQAVDDAKLFGEGPGGKAHRRADFQVRTQLQQALGIGERQHGFDDARRHRAGQVAGHDQGGNAERAVDAAPAIAVQVEEDEQVAGKERGGDGRELARMADGLAALGQEGAEFLLLELRLRPLLGILPRLDGVPPFAVLRVVALFCVN